ncbi:MAG: hypothetical protein AAFV07_09605, partial [Bacteroidota bacterium]
LFEIPAINLIYSQPTSFLGESVYRKFGDELPVYFEFIDTFEGKNLQIETFAGPDFLAKNFGLKNRQQISYYVMSGQKGAHIHIGLKKDVSSDYFKQVLQDREKARAKEITSLLNRVRLQEHDYLSIPPETILSNGRKSILLRISTASSVFRYELFRQKPSHDSLLHPQTEALIDLASQQSIGEYQLISSPRDGQVNLGKDDARSISIHQYWLEHSATFETEGLVRVLNLVAGQEISVEGDFESFIVHHSESFLVPASIEQFTIRPLNNEKIGLLIALPRI